MSLAGGDGTLEVCGLALVRREGADDALEAWEGESGGEAVGCVVGALCNVGADVAGLAVGRASAARFDAAADVAPAPLSAIIDPPQPAEPARKIRPAAAAPSRVVLPNV